MRAEESPYVFEDRGGRADLAGPQMTMLRNFRLMGEKIVLETASSVAALGRVPPTIILDFYRREELGAVSRKVGSTFFLGLSQGLPRLLSSLFSPLVATGRPLAFLLGRAGGGVLKESLQPPESDRHAAEALVSLLCEEAILYIFYHELAHIMNGHCAYLEEISGVGTLDSTTRQILEWDADSVATSLCLSRIMSRIQAPPPSMPADFSSPRGAVFLGAFVQYCIFRVSSAVGPIFEEIHRFSHPPAQIRAFLAVVVLQSCLLARKNGTSSVKSTPLVDVLIAEVPAMRSAVFVVEYCLAEVRQDDFDKVPLQQATSEEALRLVTTEYGRAWARLRPKLEPHAFWGLAPAKAVTG